MICADPILRLYNKGLVNLVLYFLGSVCHDVEKS